MSWNFYFCPWLAWGEISLLQLTSRRCVFREYLKWKHHNRLHGKVTSFVFLCSLYAANKKKEISVVDKERDIVILSDYWNILWHWNNISICSALRLWRDRVRIKMLFWIKNSGDCRIFLAKKSARVLIKVLFRLSSIKSGNLQISK